MRRCLRRMGSMQSCITVNLRKHRGEIERYVSLSNDSKIHSHVCHQSDRDRAYDAAYTASVFTSRSEKDKAQKDGSSAEMVVLCTLPSAYHDPEQCQLSGAFCGYFLYHGDACNGSRNA